MSISVVLADDHVVMRRGLALLIDQQPDFEVVAEVSDGNEAIRACIAHKPDVAVLDIKMPVTNGITAATEIKANVPGTGLVMLTFQSEISVVRAAVQAGAHGYILKDSPESELFEAIRAASDGRRHVSPYVTDLVMDSMLDSEPPTGALNGREALGVLSGREQQVLQMMAEGSSNNAIAEALHLSPKTIETYRSRLMHKLGVMSFAEIVRIAVKAGLVDKKDQ
ncbi:MAG: response regulator [Spirochaetota bacterium]